MANYTRVSVPSEGEILSAATYNTEHDNHINNGPSNHASEHASGGVDDASSYVLTLGGGGTVTGATTFSGALNVNTITERTATSGVTCDGVLLKDGEVTTDTINEETAAAGVTIDGFNIKDNAPDPTSWPSFNAWRSTAQNITSATPTTVEFDTEDFDTNSDYDNVTNYRFTPTVAGKYLVTIRVSIEDCDVADFTMLGVKNSTSIISAVDRTGQAIRQLFGTTIVDMNGSTDYLYVSLESDIDTNYNVTLGRDLSYFSASRIA